MLMHSHKILMITSFPPRKCGIATYSQDLIRSIEDKYADSCTVSVCALRKADVRLNYPQEVKYTLNTWDKEDYTRLALEINADDEVKIIYVQHEFGLYDGVLGNFILDLLQSLEKPVITTFHTVLKHPDDERKALVQRIASLSSKVIVMTRLSSHILHEEYHIPEDKLSMIPHGTHLIKPFAYSDARDVPYRDRIILSTFGLISEGKGIETALDALPRITAAFPNVLYLIIGKTHPEVIRKEGEKYRASLLRKVQELGLEKHVLFINKYLALEVLLEYLQRTDLYLFTSKDPQQAVSGTLVYAMSAACPVVSTPIPHSLELLNGAGMNFDFGNSEQLADAALLILSSPDMMEEMRLNALHKISPTAWQNAAIAHIDIAKTLFDNSRVQLQYRIPEINLHHVRRMTTDAGMIQFAKITEPDLLSGYTLDDNARALIAVAKHFELTGRFSDLPLINIYLNYILFCQQEDGTFLNYVTTDKQFYDKNQDENLEDANGRAIWALGEFLSLQQLLDLSLQAKVEIAFQKAMLSIHTIRSPRAIAFTIKGLYYYYYFKRGAAVLGLITTLADNLVSKYRGVSGDDWHWYEEYMTYANAVLPEAMLLAGECTKSDLYVDIAHKTFDFLLQTTFHGEEISVISNRGWHHKGMDKNHFGEQPIEVAYTTLALGTFYRRYQNNEYLDKMKIAFNWFLGANHLRQIMYNPITGGCYDGLEEHQVNLNQGAESTVSYLLARLAVEKHICS